MAVRKTIKTFKLQDRQLTVSGDAAFPVLNTSNENIVNLDGSRDKKVIPGNDPATIPVVLGEGIAAYIKQVDALDKFACSAVFQDGDVVSMTNCSFEGALNLDGDGVVELTISGDVRWL